MQKVSVIVPAYNCQDTIESTLKSIFNQTYQDIEVIIVNDGSTDNTLECINMFKNNQNVRIFSIPNSGVSKARNFGVSKSTCEFIALCDSDDIWHKDKLLFQMNLFENDHKIDFIGCNRNNEKTRVMLKKYDTFKRIEFTDILLKMFPQTSTVVMKKKVFEDVGGYDETQRYAEDGNLWFRICYKYNCFMMPESLVVTGGGKPSFGASGLSANLKAMHEGNLQNYLFIYKKGYISYLSYLFYYSLCQIKHRRRMLITYLRR